MSKIIDFQVEKLRKNSSNNPIAESLVEVIDSFTDTTSFIELLDSIKKERDNYER